MTHGIAAPANIDPMIMLNCTMTEKTYLAKRIKNGQSFQTHCIIAMDDEDAIYLAETVGGGLRVDLWDGDRLVKVIEPD